MKLSARCAGSRKPFFARHAVGLAERDRRDAVAVEPAILRAADKQIAVRLLIADQEIDPAGDDQPMLAVGVRVAGAQKRQQRQAGAGRVALHLA